MARRYKDEQGGRFYRVQDRLLPSVTNILSVVGKPALIGWAAKTEREMCLQAACALWDEAPAGTRMSSMAYRATLEARIGKQKAHQRELTKAGEIGNQVHALIEWNMRRELGLPVKVQPTISDAAQWAFMAWEDWRRQANLKPLAAESIVWSLQHGYAGTMDLLAEVDIEAGGRVTAVLDWKTGKAVYSEALLQNAAYVAALLEMKHATAPVHGLIVRLPKVETDPAFEVRHIPADEQVGLLEVFLAVRDLWKWLQPEESDVPEGVA
jgi:hypothetical protein